MNDVELPGFLKRWGWQEYAVCFIIAAWLVLELGLFAQYKSLPSPVYGGDVYYHFSVINHIANGNSPLMNSQFLGEYAHYPWIFHLLVAMIAWLTGVGALTAAIYAPLLTTLLAGVISYQLGKKVFGSKSFGVLFCLYWTTWQIPHAAPSPFAELVVWPLAILALLWASDEGAPLWKRALVGVAVGLCGLAQVVLWVAVFLYLALLVTWRIVEKHISHHDGWRVIDPAGIARTLKEQIIWILPIILVALPIGLLFWGPGIFVYGGVTPNRWADYVAAGDTMTLSALWNGVRGFFFVMRTWVTIAMSVLVIMGTVFVATRFKRFQTPTLLFLTGWIGYVHPIITVPFFHTSIGYYAFGYIFDLAKPLLMFTAIYLIYKSTPTAQLKLAVYGISALIFVANGYYTYAAYDTDQWTNAGRQENVMLGLAAEIIDQAPEDAVFLVTHEETGFALNAMTGKKVVLARRTHTSPFVDVNKRIADAAVMLYGNDSSTVRRLLSNYGVIYLYEDFYSYQQQTQCDQYFDQLATTPDASFACLRTTPQYSDYLMKNGVAFTRVKARLDPASPVAPTFDMLAIRPANYTYILEIGKSLRQINSQQGIVQKWVEIDPDKDL
ncbi:hypothetical protein HY641_02350 [Candidatus Woesearchaeota archaeon]|nr:hypothetical protein [Candidatus Woesearchaeota archaeon]